MASTSLLRNKVYGDWIGVVNTVILLVVMIAEVDDCTDKTMPRRARMRCALAGGLGWTPCGGDSTLSVTNHRSGV